ncbi:uncharacterized protein LOC109725737 [Ananas comosus]|uniref:Uncharacterized protein LOC109725737 n=1 Tax=Ananas comosus TaxID=4615 RepID=A0A199UH98_ANACO|nr:uncharacterized protein LOC109725737 [Ananas comosus]OAY63940.1 hypothetical protein ACMD2_15242 [Ananas comosus]
MEIVTASLCGTHVSSSGEDEPMSGVACRKMFSPLFWITISLVFLISFISRSILRVKSREKIQREIERCLPAKIEIEEANRMEEPSFSFKFQYQIPEYDNNKVSTEEPSIPIAKENELSTATSISNYRFLSEKDFSGFVEQPESVTVSVQESYIETETAAAAAAAEAVAVASAAAEEEDEEEDEEEEASLVHRKRKKENKFDTGFFSSENTLQQLSKEAYTEDKVKDKFWEKGKGINYETNLFSEDEVIGKRRFLSEEFVGSGSDSESSMSDGYSVKDIVVDSDSDCFLSEKDFGDRYEHETDATTESSMNFANFSVDLMDDIQQSEEVQSQPFDDSDAESAFSKSDSAYTNNHYLDESKELNEESRKLDLPSTSSKSSDEDVSESKREDVGEKITKENNERVEESVFQKETQENDAKKPKENQWDDLNDEENDELESLWEHQDLIEQLKMEIKKVRAIGLPTIFEESESPSPKTIEDLKPWRIDKKFLLEDPIDELHKFYKSYRERMRKFDILNYQKMYAIGFLQLKDPLQSMGAQKPLLPTLTTILSQNFGHKRKSGDDQSERFVRELRCDLETVYVGQMCLSWEFLRWQYEKARELPESDPYRSHQYNQVAGEFQQFQVLIQRFVEDESFQGPRLPNYVKNRCVLRNLIQVPVVKEDSLKEKMEEQRKGNYSITSDELEDIMEESIRLFWEFVKADKDETPGLLKGLMAPQVELQEPSDYELMMHIHSILQKKEKKLKDLLRTGNCLVKKFKKPKEDRSNQDLFFAQVDLKLVARVLRMPRITNEQLSWCHKKLDKIAFVDRKIRREPSFLLFPC